MGGVLTGYLEYMSCVCRDFGWASLPADRAPKSDLSELKMTV